jgi:Uma2 family endonuclease
MATSQTIKPIPQTASDAAEQRFVLHNISWETYEHLLADHENASTPRFTYDRGDFEIVSPMRQHEAINRALASLVEVVGEEHGIDFDNSGSTTFKRRDLERGFEPDSCFYFKNEPAIRDKRTIDLRTDPPPDLVIEIDITHSSLDNRSIFATLGVPEVWRYDGERVAILLLDGDAYVPSDRSLSLPRVQAAGINHLISLLGASSRMEWLRRVRKWARDLPR